MDWYSFDCSLCVKDGSFDIVEGLNSNVIKLRDDEPSGYYCLDGIFI